MHHNSADHQRTVKIPGILGNKEQAVQQIAKQHNNNQTAEYTQFLAHDGENHIILRLWYRPQLLYTVPQSLAKKAPASNGIQGLHNLITSGRRILLRIQPYQHTLQTEAVHIGHIQLHISQCHLQNNSSH